jgi:hypothetical protein
MSTQDKIQRLTESLLKLSSSVALSDAIDSDSDKNAGIAASPKAVSTLASVILDAAKNASEGSDGENEIYEPFLEEVKHEIGSWWFSIDGSIPAGGLPHLGHLVSRSAYGTGWTWIETNKTVVTDEEWLAYAESHNGTCPYYSYGDGSTTFRTPSYDQSFLKVLASISGAGSMEEAGLPNITGNFTAYRLYSQFVSGSGALFEETQRGENYNTPEYNTTATYNSLGLDASLSNPIYGNSDTVTPQNYGIIVGIYLVGAVSAPIGETGAAGLLNGISLLETQVAECVRSVNGVSADATGNVQGMTYSDSVTTNVGQQCLKLTNPKIQILWGYNSTATGTGKVTMSFHKPFKHPPIITINSILSGDNNYLYQVVPSAKTATACSFIAYSTSGKYTSSAIGFNFIAIGFYE